MRYDPIENLKNNPRTIGNTKKTWKVIEPITKAPDEWKFDSNWKWDPQNLPKCSIDNSKFV